MPATLLKRTPSQVFSKVFDHKCSIATLQNSICRTPIFVEHLSIAASVVIGLSFETQLKIEFLLPFLATLKKTLLNLKYLGDYFIP